MLTYIFCCYNMLVSTWFLFPYIARMTVILRIDQQVAHRNTYKIKVRSVCIFAGYIIGYIVIQWKLPHIYCAFHEFSR